MYTELSVYSVSFWVALLICLVVTVYARMGTPVHKSSAAFSKFQMIYLVVYYCAVSADWLQGPYVYALYDAYGYSKKDIAILFVAGFGSSAIFGTFIGTMADKHGRKMYAIWYVVIYTLSCVTKHYDNFWILMVGRLLGGIATSLLFSVFESWMVGEHTKNNFEKNGLSDTFSKQFFGNSVVAILAGLLGEWSSGLSPLTQSELPTEPHFGGFVAPFDCSIVFLLICGVLVFLFWDENYGSVSNTGVSSHALLDAMNIIRNDPKVLYIGVISSLFEGSMYTFVFLWTPVLKSAAPGEELPFGMIFASFMISCMTGSSLFQLLTDRNVSPQNITRYVFLLASISLILPVIFNHRTVVMVSFMLFEGCVGLYFPSFSTLKGIYVPESSRSAIYNLYRLPLNAIVLVVLLSEIESNIAFLVCSIMLAAAFVCSILLSKEIMKSKVDTRQEDDVENQQLLLNEATL